MRLELLCEKNLKETKIKKEKEKEIGRNQKKMRLLDRQIDRWIDIELKKERERETDRHTDQQTYKRGRERKSNRERKIDVNEN